MSTVVKFNTTQASDNENQMSLSFVLTTFGSLGDLHPHMALAIGLRNRGHKVRIVTTEYFRAKIEAEGLEFYPSRPDFRPIFDDGEVWRKAFDERTGTEYIVRVLIAPHVSDMYDDLLEASRGADVIVGHPIALAAPLVAEKLGMPWASVALAPCSI